MTQSNDRDGKSPDSNFPSPQRRLVRVLAFAFVAGMVSLPVTTMADDNPYHDPDALEGDLIDLCSELSVDANAILSGRCNIQGPNEVSTVSATIDLSFGISDACYKWFDLHFSASQVEISAGCSHPDQNNTVTRNGVVHKGTVESRAKLDDMVSWQQERHRFVAVPGPTF